MFDDRQYIAVEDFTKTIREVEDSLNNQMQEKVSKLKKKYASMEKDYKKLQVEHSRLLFDIDAVIEHEVDVKCKKLKEELEEVEKDLAHRDSFFSMMYDVLGNENVSSYLLYDIVNAVVKSECWAEEELDEEDLDCLKKFWEWFYKSF